MQDYSGKIVIVTGAGSGMGRAIVAEFIARGAKVAALGRRFNKLQETLAVAAGSGEGMAIGTDVAEEAQVQAAVAAVKARWGRIDVLINNAGVLDSYAPVHEVSLAEWNAVIATNLTGPFLMAKHAINPMLEQGKGAIVNIS